ncbi:MAG TPA: DUF1552 domain-containing protein [Polyangiaceae bacterium]|nr:DUF1552 domain-containing protein [Polyangiaceae bacterium]
MPRRVVDLTRRTLLKGAGGAVLALPFLPSLAEKTALGDPIYSGRPRLFWFATDHGGAYEANMFPDTATLSKTVDLFADHKVSSGTLKASIVGDRASLSPILSAKSSALGDRLVGKMNVLRGLDVPFYISHNTGLHLGNYARNDGNGGDGVEAQKSPRPTIDQIMAWSRSFYPDVASVKQRSMLMNSGRTLSWNWSDPGNQAGTIQNVRGTDSSRDLFNAIFVSPGAAKAPVADRVLESYKMLRNGSARLSSKDRQRIDDHIDRLAELDRKLNATASCGNVVKPTDDASSHQRFDAVDAATHWKLFTDVVAAAFVCGTSRIAVAGVGGTEKFAAYQGDWHQEVAHQWQKPDKQRLLTDSYQRFFESVFLDAAAKLDVEEAPGVTYLDNTLLAWSQECSMATHDSASIPIVTMGSASGFFQTGVYADYRKINGQNSKVDPLAGNVTWLGLLYNQWLANVLLAMRVPPAEFEKWGHKGYGVPLLTKESWTPPYAKHYESTTSRYFQMASDVLPFLKKA